MPYLRTYEIGDNGGISLQECQEGSPFHQKGFLYAVSVLYCYNPDHPNLYKREYFQQTTPFVRLEGAEESFEDWKRFLKHTHTNCKVVEQEDIPPSLGGDLK